MMQSKVEACFKSAEKTAGMKVHRFTEAFPLKEKPHGCEASVSDGPIVSLYTF